jgi:hypothetical protein
VTFSYIHVLYPALVHSLHYYPSFPTPLLKMTSTGFNVPFLFLLDGGAVRA